jgi:hypothetical protein
VSSADIQTDKVEPEIKIVEQIVYKEPSPRTEINEESSHEDIQVDTIYKWKKVLNKVNDGKVFTEAVVELAPVFEGRALRHSTHF